MLVIRVHLRCTIIVPFEWLNHYVDGRLIFIMQTLSRRTQERNRWQISNCARKRTL